MDLCPRRPITLVSLDRKRLPGYTGAVEEEQSPPPAGSPADKLILVVDDDPLIRDLLKLALTGSGFQVVMATNGIEAARVLEEKEPDLIVADLMMPVQGGYEFLRSLQGSPGGHLPIVIVTASLLDPSTVRMIRSEANVVEFVNKPIPMTKFLATIHRELRTQPPASASTSRGLNER